MTTLEGLRHSKSIQRQTGRTFHLATRLFPRRIRHPTYVLYAFFRMADQIVDTPNPAPPDVQRSALNKLEGAALGRRPSEDPVLIAFNAVRKDHDIPEEEIVLFVDAMRQDIDSSDTIDGFASVEEMAEYLRGSAVAVGHMMLHVMNPSALSKARPHAQALGEAFQLTNFLRDVREDLTEYNRVYLPETTLRANGVTREQIERLQWTPGVRASIQAELHRAEDRYRHGVAGIRYLPSDCQFPVLLAAVFYAEYHRLIRGRDFNVLDERPHIGWSRYLRLFLHTGMHWLRTRDPEAVFYRVSPIEQDATRQKYAMHTAEPRHPMALIDEDGAS